MLDSDELKKITATINDKHPGLGVEKIEVNEANGTSSFYLQPTKTALAFLDKTAVVPHEYRGKASVITRDSVTRTDLDLIKKDVNASSPTELFDRAMKYYYSEPLIGTSINLLASLAAKGFEHDIDDEDIKYFYDSWAFDVRFDEILEWIFLDFFKIGHVTTYKTIASYEPKVSPISPPGKKSKKQKTAAIEAAIKLEVEKALLEAKSRGITNKTELANIEDAAKKKIWSKGHLPIAYTVLNPMLTNIEGNLLFNNYNVTIKAPTELTALIKKPQSELSDDEKILIKSLPNDFKAAITSGKDFKLDPRLVGSITYRKQPYERYAKPRTSRIFDTIEYKRSLREADISTLDGITNYILKITIGNDEYPVTSQTELEAVAQLFNTSSKSFDVVWNHTLKVEKIVSPEISSILGKEKYAQVNEDMTAGLGITRSIIDGGTGSSTAEIQLMTKGLVEEINYARAQVTRWIYREYQQIAEAMGFDRFPKIRWDDGVLKDTILYMNTLAQLVDRRMLSYKTALESLGFDYANELSNMTTELPSVQEGILGIIGSPWQQSKSTSTPTGTPSEGRPANEPAPPVEPVIDPNQKVSDNNKKKKPSQTQKTGASLTDLVKEMSPEDYAQFKLELDKIRLKED